VQRIVNTVTAAAGGPGVAGGVWTTNTRSMLNRLLLIRALGELRTTTRPSLNLPVLLHASVLHSHSREAVF